MSSSRRNTSDDNPSVPSVISLESPQVPGTKEHTHFRCGNGPHPHLCCKREERNSATGCQWGSAMRSGKGDQFMLWAMFTSLGHATQTPRRNHSEPICALTSPTITSKHPPSRGFSADSSRFPREGYSANADCGAERWTRPVSAAAAANTNGVVSSHLLLTCHRLLKHEEPTSVVNRGSTKTLRVHVWATAQH